MPETTQNPVEQLLASFEEAKGQLFRCRYCNTAITHHGEKMEVGVSHQHRFTNPAGILFSIGCFHNAPGCSLQGEPTEQDSWFGGYRWQLALCSECHEHLGWYYQNRHEKFFFGLISGRLTIQQQL